jgi:small subunit ribosomal protein S20
MENKDKESLGTVLKKTVSYINKAASKGIIHKNNAARKVSRLSKKVHSFLQEKV